MRCVDDETLNSTRSWRSSCLYLPGNYCAAAKYLQELPLPGGMYFMLLNYYERVQLGQAHTRCRKTEILKKICLIAIAHRVKTKNSYGILFFEKMYRKKCGFFRPNSCSLYQLSSLQAFIWLYKQSISSFKGTVLSLHLLVASCKVKPSPMILWIASSEITPSPSFIQKVSSLPFCITV